MTETNKKSMSGCLVWVTYAEAFEHLDRLAPSHENAFLLRKD